MQSSDEFGCRGVASEGGFWGVQSLKSGGKEGASYAEREELPAAITHWLNPSAAVYRKGREARPPHFFWSFDSMSVQYSHARIQPVR